MKSKILIVIIVIVVVAGAAYAIKKSRSQKETKSNTKTEQSGQAGQGSKEIKVTQVDNAKVPEKIPSDIPMEEGATIEQNFTAVIPGTNKTQYTRVFVSKKTLADNFTIYKNYLTSHNWNILATVNQDKLKSFSASNSTGHLDIILSTNTVTKENRVNISFTSN